MQGHRGLWEIQTWHAFILLVPGKTVKGEMAFRLAMVWAHPYQACLSSLDEVARKLTLLFNIGDNWVYAFMHLNEGTLDVPLSNKGHISDMIDGVPSRSTCGNFHPLEGHKLLQWGEHVVCTKGLNGGLEPVLLSLPELPICNMNILIGPVHEPLLLQVDLSHVRLGEQAPLASGLCKASTPPSSSHFATESPSATANCNSMATKF